MTHDPRTSPRTTRPGSAEAKLPAPPWGALALATLLGLVLGGLAPLGELVSRGGITAVELLSDPLEMPDPGWYTGGVASLNMFLWAGAVALFLTAAAGLWSRERRLALALAWWGVLSGIILLDDRFLLHELVLPHFGIPELVSYVAYGLAALGLVLGYGRMLVRHRETWLLGMALVGMGLSVLLDMSGIDSDVRRVAEEIAKMVGATALLLFPALLLVRRLSGGGHGTRS